MINSQIKVQKFIQQGISAYEDNVNNRRKKLRDLLMAEETELLSELAEKLKQDENIKTAETNRRNEELQILEGNKLKFAVQAKINKRHLENCSENRATFSEEIRRRCKYCNKMHIFENKDRKLEEKKINELWHNIMLKESMFY